MPRRNNRAQYDTKEITLETLNGTDPGGTKAECRNCLLYGYGFDCRPGDTRCVRNGGAKPTTAEGTGDSAVTHK